MLRGKNTSPFNIKSHFDGSLGDESLNMSWYRPKYTNQRETQYYGDILY